MTFDGRPPRPKDPELTRLLLEELKRHAPALAAKEQGEPRRRALHSLKGSAGIAGERSFAESLARIERRAAGGDATALDDASALVLVATEALEAGLSIPAAVWPMPPEDLRVSPVASVASGGAHYLAEMQDRLLRIDVALSAGAGDEVPAALGAYREVHAMKGAALAVSDEVTAWFCHGLEEILRAGGRSEEAAREALAELSRWRGVLSEVVHSPERALETLRRASTHAPPLHSIAPSFAPPSIPAPPPLPYHRRVSLEPPSEAEPRSSAGDDLSLRVPTSTLDRLFERVRQLGQARAGVDDGATMVFETAARARRLRQDLAEALRLIGPPRPWGAPAAAIRRIDEAARGLVDLSERLDRENVVLKETADRLRVESAAAHQDLAAIRTTTMAWLFERVAAAVTAQARREGREVRLQFSGEETAIDRRVAEMLFDPILQLARNAVTHGIETASERALRGKSRVGSVQLAARARSGGFRLVVQDDGAGVDVGDVRLRAVSKGTISAETAAAADDQTLLALLFIPGFTTRDHADLLAGRGVGLDLALEAVHRLGGTIRLASQPGMGLRATLDIPFEPGLVKVLWVEAGGATYALPVQRTRRIFSGKDAEAEGAIPLSACLRGPSAPSPGGDLDDRLELFPSFVIALEPAREGVPIPLLGVDRIGIVEEVALRGVSPLIATAGPYAGAVVRGTELRLCLDPLALAEVMAAGGG